MGERPFTVGAWGAANDWANHISKWTNDVVDGEASRSGTNLDTWAARFGEDALMAVPFLGEVKGLTIGTKIAGEVSEGIQAAEGATEVAGLMGPKGNVVVLGRLEDTAVAKAWPGHTVLDTPNWSLELNDAFVIQTIKEGRTVYLASPLDGNLIQTAGKYAGQPTIYARELEQLTSAGYTRVGDYLRPPGS